MGSVVWILLSGAVLCFILVLILEKKTYCFGGNKEKARRVDFFNRYKNGHKLEPGDKALFEELLKTSSVINRSTKYYVKFTHKGLLILTKEEFDARCDLRAKVLKLFSVIH